MPLKRLSNIIGFDDAPFPRNHRGKVKVVGAVFANLRLDGIVIGEIERDGRDAAMEIERLVGKSKFAEHVQLIMLQGIAMGGFNVVDVFYLHEKLGLPLMVISRNSPDMKSIREALTSHIPEGEKKWAIIDQLGPMQPMKEIYVQRVGITFEQAASVINRFAIHSQIPEPLRTAHLIAGAIATGVSRGNP